MPQCEPWIDMKCMLLLLVLSFGFTGCSTERHIPRREASAIPSEPQSRLPAGTVNTTRNTGNRPEVLNPHNLSDQQ